MKKLLLAALLSLSINQFAMAQDTTSNTEEETNAFGFPDKSIVAVIENSDLENANQVNDKPDCNNPQMMQLAKDTLKSFINIPSQTITNKRRHDLILKNVANFEELKIADIDLKLNRAVAARLVELKINNHISDSNIKICQSDNLILSTNLYLIIYDKGDDVIVDIVNFQRDLKPSFVWPKQ